MNLSFFLSSPNQPPPTYTHERTDDYHVPNGEWQMQEIKFFEEDTPFECCRQPFSTITFQIRLTRYPDFYNLYVFLPFISQLVLFLLIFNIHPDHGDRLSYGVALLLNMTMYMIFISDKLPEKSDKLTFVGAMFVTLFFVLSFGLVLSALTMSYSARKTPLPEIVHRVGRLVDRIVLLFSCCFSFCEEKRSRKASLNSSLYMPEKPAAVTFSRQSFHRQPENDAYVTEALTKETALIEKCQDETTDQQHVGNTSVGISPNSPINAPFPVDMVLENSGHNLNSSLDSNDNTNHDGDISARRRMISSSSGNENTAPPQTTATTTTTPGRSARRFQNWFQFMRFVEKLLTVLFAFLLVVIPLIIVGTLDIDRKQ